MTTQPYEFFEHTADVGMRAFGKTQTELFENAARGLYAAMGEFVTNGESIAHELELSAPNVEDLLIDFLRELHFLFDTRRWVFTQFKWHAFELGETASMPSDVAFADDGGGVAHKHALLRVTLLGGVADFAKSTLKTELKAVTYHDLKVARTDDVWNATLILDV